MIGVAMYITIKTLWERCRNKSKIARLTGHDWKTVAKMIKAIEEGKEYPMEKYLTFTPRARNHIQESWILTRNR